MTRPHFGPVAKKSGPLTPPCPNHPRWRRGVLPKQEARGSRRPRRCRGRARGQGQTGRTQRRIQLKAGWPVDRDKTLSRFCPAWKSKNCVSRARNTPLRSLFLSAWEAKGSWSCTARPAGLDFPRSALQPCSGCRNPWERLQAQRNAQEVPGRAVVLGGDRFRGGWGFQRGLSGWGWGLSVRGSRRGCGSTPGRWHSTGPRRRSGSDQYTRHHRAGPISGPVAGGSIRRDRGRS